MLDFDTHLKYEWNILYTYICCFIIAFDFYTCLYRIDLDLWRQQNLTGKAEELLEENFRLSKPIFSPTTGDQGAFYALMQENVSYLPPRFNIRRHPVGSALSQLESFPAIMHFAGTKGGLHTLCLYPGLFVKLLKSALPLLHSVVSSFRAHVIINKLEKLFSGDLLKLLDSCGSAAFDKLLIELKSRELNVSYFGMNNSHENFLWPPSFSSKNLSSFNL